MNSKLSKFSDEKLEQKLAKMLKYQKILNWAVIAALILTVLSFLTEGVKIHLGSPLSILVFGLILKFIMYPMQIGAINTEINNRNAIKQNQNMIKM